MLNTLRILAKHSTRPGDDAQFHAPDLASHRQSNTQVVARHTAMGKRKGRPSDEPLSPAEHRAAQLRAHVEALARQPEALSEGVSSADVDAFVARKPSEPQDRSGASLPMLIRTTDTGVYLKWSIMLQDQLARMKAAYESVCQENAMLRASLGVPSAEAGDAAASAPSTAPMAGYGLVKSVSERSSCSAVSTSTCDAYATSQAASQKDASVPSAAPSSTPEVASTPRQSDVFAKPSVASALEKETVDLGSAASALIVLGSPKPSPRSEITQHLSSESPASVAASTTSETAIKDCMTMWPRGESHSLTNSPAAAMPPPPRPDASPAPFAGLSPGPAARLSEQDDLLLADLLNSPSAPNLLNSPHLSFSLKSYFDRGGSASPMLAHGYGGGIGGGRMQPPSPLPPRGQPAHLQQYAHDAPLQPHMQQEQFRGAYGAYPARPSMGHQPMGDQPMGDMQRSMCNAQSIHAHLSSSTPYFARRNGQTWSGVREA